MPDTLESVKQQPALDELVEFFDIDVTALGGTVLHVTSSVYTGSSVIWDGVTYAPIPLEASGFASDGSGTLPTPHLKMANVNLAASGLNISFNDLLGSVVTRHRTFRRFLDGQSQANPTEEFPPEIYRIDRKVAQNKVLVEWELASVLDQEGLRLPARPVLQSACPFVYRYWAGVDWDLTRATCPYNGADTPAPFTASTSYFDINGNVVATPALDRASKRFDTCCKKRFPTGILPFGGFPGAER